MAWLQREIQLPPYSRGCHIITRQVLSCLPELAGFRIGLMHVFLMHTSASLSLNENADPDVPKDLETTLRTLVPDDLPYRHTIEGPDDMSAHVKSSLLGCSLLLPIRDGRPCLGTWQGILLFEHRQHASGRRLLVTLHGEPS